MQDKDIVIYLIDYFGLSNNPFVINDLLGELETLTNKDNLIPFIKQYSNYESFKFIKGLEKLTALIETFKKENKPKLDEVSQEKANTFAYKLYKKTINVFDEVNFLIQEGSDIRSKAVSDYIGLAFMNQPKEIQVLEIVGRREELLRLCNTNKIELENKIFKAVERLALVKKYPQLEKKNEDKKSLENLTKKLGKA